MLLQCDPTVIYALEQNDSYNGTLTLKDLRFSSPYNTYLHAGLPPGPIGNPGEASLRAALNPSQLTISTSWPTRRVAIFLPPRWWNITKMWPNITGS